MDPMGLVDFEGINVGKYTVRPMDPSWLTDSSWIFGHWPSGNWRKWIDIQARMLHVWCFLWVLKPKIGGFPPKWMVKILENHINPWMIWGEIQLFLETPIYLYQNPPSVSNFSSAGLVLMAKGLKFQTLGGFRYLHLPWDDCIFTYI